MFSIASLPFLNSYLPFFAGQRVRLPAAREPPALQSRTHPVQHRPHLQVCVLPDSGGNERPRPAGLHPGPSAAHDRRLRRRGRRGAPAGRQLASVLSAEGQRRPAGRAAPGAGSGLQRAGNRNDVIQYVLREGGSVPERGGAGHVLQESRYVTGVTSYEGGLVMQFRGRGWTGL